MKCNLLKQSPCLYKHFSLSAISSPVLLQIESVVAFLVSLDYLMGEAVIYKYFY